MRNARDRLIGLARAQAEWWLGLEDERWWSRLAHPTLCAWAQEDQPVRLREPVKVATDPQAKALACYGLWGRGPNRAPGEEQVWLRVVDGRPVRGGVIRLRHAASAVWR